MNNNKKRFKWALVVQCLLALLLSGAAHANDDALVPVLHLLLDDEGQPSNNTHTLSININGSGAVVSSVLGIDCASSCQIEIAKDAQVTLNALPGNNQTFQGWSQSCSGSAACQFSMSEPRQVTANFVTSVVVQPGQIFFQSQPSAFQGNCLSENSFGVQFGDINFDGWTDFVTFSHQHNQNLNPPVGRHCAWLNSNGQVFNYDANASDELTLINGLSCTWTAQIADFNGDAKPDIWCRGSESKSDFYLNTTQTVGGSPTFQHTDSWLGESSGDNIGGYKDRFYFADFNGDGKLQRVNEEGKIRNVDNAQLTQETGLEHGDWFDIDGDTYPDLWSPTTRKVMRNNGDGSFSEASYDADLDECYYTNAVYHIDLDKDGDLDLLCLVYNDNPKSDLIVLRNNGNFDFSQVDAGNFNLYASNYARLNLTKGSLVVEDFDNDSMVDIVNVSVAHEIRLLQQKTPASFERIDDSNFIDLSTWTHMWHMSSADYNHDGLVDMLVNARYPADLPATSVLYKNTSNTQNKSLGILLRGDQMGSGKNVNALGALIVVKKANSNTIIASHYVDNNSRRNGPNYLYHIGVGNNATVDIEIKWPSGFEASQKFEDIQTNKSYRIEYRHSANDTLQNWAPGSGW